MQFLFILNNNSSNNNLDNDIEMHLNQYMVWLVIFVSFETLFFSSTLF